MKSWGVVSITFRRLVDTDLPMLHGWLNDPGVVEWWEGDDVSPEAVARDYDPASGDSTEHWIGLVDAVEIGWIQCYPAVDEPDETAAWFALGVDRTAAGIDYLVGEPSARGKGVGSAMIRAFVVDIVFGLHPQWSQACAGPYAANAPSWRALEKAGFRFVGTIDDADGPCRLMMIDRRDVDAS